MVIFSALTKASIPTLPYGSFSKTASKIASDIWSAILSGCPSVTDSEVNSYLLFIFNSSFIFFVLYPKTKKPLHNRRGNYFFSSLGNEFTFRGIWHQHNVFNHDMTGCRASQGPSLHQLLIRAQYSIFKLL